MDQGSGRMLLLTALVLAAALVACGSEKETLPPATGTVLSASTPTAGLNICAGCHAQETADWLTTKHANLNNPGDLSGAGTPTLGQISGCTQCHDPNRDSSKVALVSSLGTRARPVVGCESCHGPGSLHAEKGGVGPISLLSNTTGKTIGSVTVSGQFVMCTICHELLNSTATGTIAAIHDTGGTSPTGNQYIITDTHFATAGDWSGGANSNNVTGYAMDYAYERVCIDCHNPHKTANINREWARSKHADTTAAGAWAHYNWSQSTRRVCERCHTTTALAKYADALGSGDVTQAEQISSGTVTLIAYSAGWKPEMLKCNGCHADNKGTLRNPGAYTANYSYSTAGATAAAQFSYPDASSSNVCILCHSARQNGDSIKNLVLSNPTTTNFSNLSFIDSHYLAAAGTMFNAGGYEFSGRSYANPGTFKHGTIGTPAEPNTGSSGPCVGCHMYRTGDSANHLFRAVSKDANDNITGVVSEVCYQCHAGSSTSLAEVVEKEKVEYEDAIAALIDQLDRKGISFYPGYPYMFQQRTKAGTVAVTNGNAVVTGTGTAFVTAGTKTTDYFRVQVDGTAYGIASVDFETQITLTTNYTGTDVTGAAYVIMKGTRSDAVTNWRFGGSDSDGRNNMGAAFNLQFLEHEPGAYIHNSKYVKRLIYDSIDWIDNGGLDFSVGKTLNALPAETAYKAGAMKYLLPNGVLWNYTGGYGIDTERPY